MAAVGFDSALYGESFDQHETACEITATSSGNAKISSGASGLKLPVFPREGCSIDELKPWLEKCLSIFDQGPEGLGQVVRGQVPSLAYKWHPRDLSVADMQPIAINADGTNVSSVVRQDERISNFKHDNLVKALAKDAWYLERQLFCAALLTDSLKPRASFLLARGRKEFALTPATVTGAITLRWNQALLEAMGAQ